MILPLPVAAEQREQAVRFINLEGYEGFFTDMNRAFPRPQSSTLSLSGATPRNTAKTLEVEHVGSFEASYVPSVADFGRLDERFRLPAGTWEKLPAYRNFGFAVFKLKSGNTRPHPMALTFCSAMPGTLFFPTVHIHDGQVHEYEEFDHMLYAQGWTNALIGGREWEESAGNAASVMRKNAAHGLVWPDGHLYRRAITGQQKNEDILAKAKRMAW